MDKVIIYKIEFNNEIYIGSTINLKRRLKEHKRQFRIGSKCLIYKYMRENEFNENDIKLSMLEQFNIKDRSKKEGEYIRLLGTLNKQISGRTKEEYRDENSDDLKIINKKYYEDNKEKILMKCKNYRDENRDKIKKHNQQIFIKNKSKLQIKNKEKYLCHTCNIMLATHSAYRHNMTLKHITMLNAI